MFRPLESAREARAEITVDGQTIDTAHSANLAAALLEAGFAPFRNTPVSAAPRMPYCMMGVCFDCLVTINGVPNRQACLEKVRPGMIVERQLGAARAGTAG
jgi:hypothetical protein